MTAEQTRQMLRSKHQQIKDEWKGMTEPEQRIHREDVRRRAADDAERRRQASAQSDG